MSTTGYEEIEFSGDNGDTYYMNANISDGDVEITSVTLLDEETGNCNPSDLNAFLKTYESDAIERVMEYAADLWIDEKDRYDADAYDRYYDR